MEDLQPHLHHVIRLFFHLVVTPTSRFVVESLPTRLEIQVHLLVLFEMVATVLNSSTLLVFLSPMVQWVRDNISGRLLPIVLKDPQVTSKGHVTVLALPKSGRTNPSLIRLLETITSVILEIQEIG